MGGNRRLSARQVAIEGIARVNPWLSVSPEGQPNVSGRAVMRTRMFSGHVATASWTASRVDSGSRSNPSSTIRTAGFSVRYANGRTTLRARASTFSRSGRGTLRPNSATPSANPGTEPRSWPQDQAQARRIGVAREN